LDIVYRLLRTKIVIKEMREESNSVKVDLDLCIENTTALNVFKQASSLEELTAAEAMQNNQEHEVNKGSMDAGRRLHEVGCQMLYLGKGEKATSPNEGKISSSCCALAV
jgi:hypothetical protein